MSVIRWNPLREFDELFAHALHKQVSRQTNGLPARTRFTPLADIAETDAGYLIELELPGFAAEDVAVTVHDGVLSVSGERKPSQILGAAGQDGTAEADSTPQPGLRVHRAERAQGAFERRFTLPKDADANAVNATSSNGVLTLEVGRLAEAARRAIEVKVA